MKLKYHLDRKDDGLVVLEAAPQMRSLFVYSQTKNIIRVPLPYVVFVVRYKGKVLVYPGIYGSGLHVFCRTETIKSPKDRVCLLPTDSINYGLVCTSHESDNRQFKSVKELVNFVVTFWYTHLHQVEYQPFGVTAWWEAKLENFADGNWKDADCFHKALSLQKSYGTPEERGISPKAEFIDRQWPVDLEHAPYYPQPVW